ALIDHAKKVMAANWLCSNLGECTSGIQRRCVRSQFCCERCLVPGHLAAQTDLGPAAKVAGSYIRNHELSSKGWPTIGLDYAETRRSKLTQTNDANVKELGLAWSYNHRRAASRRRRWWSTASLCVGVLKHRA